MTFHLDDTAPDKGPFALFCDFLESENVASILMRPSHSTRRQFILRSAAAFALPVTNGSGAAAASPFREKASFRVLYNNDTTNVTGCVSPFHKAKEPFRPEMLEASVDEVANRGVDVHLLQPGLGMVPMWPSKVLSLPEHYAWVQEHFGVKPDIFGAYTLKGGDVVKLFVDRCRLRGQAPFISFRLNDAHNKEFAEAKRGDKVGGAIGMSVTRFFVEHLDYRIGPDMKHVEAREQNWAIPEVRAQKFALLQELCENYDLDGVELDFLRFYSFFRQDKTTVEERRGIMTGFVKDVRHLLDRTERAGKRRWLCARIPCYIKAFDPMGLDLPAMVEAGLDMVNVSASYFTVQQSDLAKIRQLVPNASVYLELCHSTWNGPKLIPGYDTFAFRRTTQEQLHTAAHLAYARGANGVSAFNFAYYREHGSAGRGPFHEPPFEVFQGLRDPAWLARQPQHYFLAPGWDNPFVRPALLPRKMEAGKPVSFTLDLAPPASGWAVGGRLRIQAATAWGEAEVEASLNGSVLDPTPDVSEPYPNPDPPLLGKAEALRAWQVPAATLRDGKNEVRFQFKSGPAASVVFVDLAAG